MNQARFVFYGTSEFSVPILESLSKDSRFSIMGVVTQPDRPVGRHATLEEPPVKQKAKELGLNVLQFDKVKSDEAYDVLKGLEADVAVVASFGQIIPQRVLDLYPRGMVNVHPSLLPKYRGSIPIPAAIREGDKETAITFMLMDALMDHGPILKQIEHESIHADDTTETLSERLAKRSAQSLPDVLDQYIKGVIKPTDQNHDEATVVKPLTREDGLLKPEEQTAEQMERLVRAYTPWPGTYIVLEEKRIKIFKSEVASVSGTAGQRITVDGYPALVGKDGKTLRLIQIQPEGKSPMDGKAFLNGYKTWNQ